MKTKIEITPAILKAIRQAVLKAGSQSALSRASKVNQPTLNTLVNSAGKQNRTITRATWDKLYPFIAPYLSASNNSIVQNVQGNHNTSTINASCESAVIDKLLASTELSDAEKVKVIRILRK